MFQASFITWRLVASFVLALVPVVHVFVPLAAVLLLPVLTIGAQVYARVWPYIRQWPVLLAAVFVIYLGMTVFWSVDPSRTLDRSLRMVLEITLALALFAAIAKFDKRLLISIWRVLSFSYVAVLSLAVIDVALGGQVSAPFRPNSLFHFYGRAPAITALMAPAIGLGFYLLGQRLWACYTLILALVFVVFAQNGAAQLAVGLSLLALGGVALFPWLRHVFLVCVAVVFVGGPWAFGNVISNEQFCSWSRAHDTATYHRAMIWSFALDRLAERPVLGWGLDAARAIPGADDNSSHPDCLPPETWGLNQIMPLHPHNGVMHVWLELGVVGAFLGLGLILSTLRKAYALNSYRSLQALITGSAAAYFIIALLSFGVWQGWWIATLIMTMAFIQMTCRMVRDLQAGSDHADGVPSKTR